MKKIFRCTFCFLLVLALCISVTACGNASIGSETTEPTQEVRTMTQPETSDTSAPETTEADTTVSTTIHEVTVPQTMPQTAKSTLKIKNEPLQTPNMYPLAPHANISATESEGSYIRFSESIVGCIGKKLYDLDADGKQELLVFTAWPDPDPKPRQELFSNGSYINMDIFEWENGTYVNRAHLSKLGADGYFFGTMNTTFTRLYIFIVQQGDKALICLDMNETWSDGGMRALFTAFTYDGNDIQKYASGTEYGSGDVGFGCAYYDAGAKCGLPITSVDYIDEYMDEPQRVYPYDVYDIMVSSFFKNPIAIYSQDTVRTRNDVLDEMNNDSIYNHVTSVTVKYKIQITEDVQ